MPLGGVGDFGFLIPPQQGGGTGSRSTFGPSLTDPVFGIDDHPDAITNNNWSITADYGPVLPVCRNPNAPSSTALTITGFVPPQGARSTFTCHL